MKYECTESERHTIIIDQDKPDCTHDDGHDWISPVVEKVSYPDADDDSLGWVKAHTCPECGTTAPEVYDEDENPAWDCSACKEAAVDDE